MIDDDIIIMHRNIEIFTLWVDEPIPKISKPTLENEGQLGLTYLIRI